MPEFEGAREFPSPADDLPRLPLARWGPLVFVALEPRSPFEAWIGPLRERLAALPVDALRFDPAGTRDYEVRANWMLYCDNYLEGFHIPFVHPGLACDARLRDVPDRDLPRRQLADRHRPRRRAGLRAAARLADRGQRVAAYYAWLFPNLMLNFYPWGLSVNIVQPLALDRTRVRFPTYVGTPRGGARARAATCTGSSSRTRLSSRACSAGSARGSTTADASRQPREIGVHHFHRLLAAALEEDA